MTQPRLPKMITVLTELNAQEESKRPKSLEEVKELNDFSLDPNFLITRRSYLAWLLGHNPQFKIYETVILLLQHPELNLQTFCQMNLYRYLVMHYKFDLMEMVKAYGLAINDKQEVLSDILYFITHHGPSGEAKGLEGTLLWEAFRLVLDAVNEINFELVNLHNKRTVFFQAFQLPPELRKKYLPLILDEIHVSVLKLIHAKKIKNADELKAHFKKIIGEEPEDEKGKSEFKEAMEVLNSSLFKASACWFEAKPGSIQKVRDLPDPAMRKLLLEHGAALEDDLIDRIVKAQDFKDKILPLFFAVSKKNKVLLQSLVMCDEVCRFEGNVKSAWTGALLRLDLSYLFLLVNQVNYSKPESLLEDALHPGMTVEWSTDRVFGVIRLLLQSKKVCSDTDLGKFYLKVSTQNRSDWPNMSAVIFREMKKASQRMLSHFELKPQADYFTERAKWEKDFKTFLAQQWFAGREDVLTSARWTSLCRTAYFTAIAAKWSDPARPVVHDQFTVVDCRALAYSYYQLGNFQASSACIREVQKKSTKQSLQDLRLFIFYDFLAVDVVQDPFKKLIYLVAAFEHQLKADAIEAHTMMLGLYRLLKKDISTLVNAMPKVIARQELEKVREWIAKLNMYMAEYREHIPHVILSVIYAVIDSLYVLIPKNQLTSQDELNQATINFDWARAESISVEGDKFLGIKLFAKCSDFWLDQIVQSNVNYLDAAWRYVDSVRNAIFACAQQAVSEIKMAEEICKKAVKFFGEKIQLIKNDKEGQLQSYLAILQTEIAALNFKLHPENWKQCKSHAMRAISRIKPRTAEEKSCLGFYRQVIATQLKKLPDLVKLKPNQAISLMEDALTIMKEKTNNFQEMEAQDYLICFGVHQEILYRSLSLQDLVSFRALVDQFADAKVMLKHPEYSDNFSIACGVVGWMSAYFLLRDQAWKYYNDAVLASPARKFLTENPKPVLNVSQMNTMMHLAKCIHAKVELLRCTAASPAKLLLEALGEISQAVKCLSFVTFDHHLTNLKDAETTRDAILSLKKQLSDYNESRKEREKLVNCLAAPSPKQPEKKREVVNITLSKLSDERVLAEQKQKEVEPAKETVEVKQHPSDKKASSDFCSDTPKPNTRSVDQAELAKLKMQKWTSGLFAGKNGVFPYYLEVFGIEQPPPDAAFGKTM